MNKITMTTPLYTIEIKTDVPMTVLQCWEAYNIEKYGKKPFRKHSYMHEGHLVRGHKMLWFYAGEPVADDFLVPVNNTEYFQVMGAYDYDDPMPDATNIYY